MTYDGNWLWVSEWVKQLEREEVHAVTSGLALPTHNNITPLAQQAADNSYIGCDTLSTSIHIIKIAQFDFLSVSRAQSVIHRPQLCKAQYTEPLWLVILQSGSTTYPVMCCPLPVLVVLSDHNTPTLLRQVDWRQCDMWVAHSRMTCLTHITASCHH